MTLFGSYHPNKTSTFTLLRPSPFDSSSELPTYSCIPALHHSHRLFACHTISLSIHLPHDLFLSYAYHTNASYCVTRQRHQTLALPSPFLPTFTILHPSSPVSISFPPLLSYLPPFLSCLVPSQAWSSKGNTLSGRSFLAPLSKSCVTAAVLLLRAALMSAIHPSW